MTTEHREPSKDDVAGYLRRTNWGRWGADDQRGAINLITPEKRVAAARLVRSGRSVSLRLVAAGFDALTHSEQSVLARR